jgi:regulator of protease activity HflC (stomatin/prohibitin superfamily)
MDRIGKFDGIFKERRPAMFPIQHIRGHERGLWFRRGDFLRLLGPGAHWIWTRPLRAADRIEVVDTLKTRFEHPLLEVLARSPRLREELEVIDLKDGERALVYREERLFAILGTGLHAFWKAPAAVRVERFAIEAFRFTHPKLAVALAHRDAAAWFEAVKVEAGEEVLLFRDGVLVETLGRGLHVFWKGTGDVRIRKVDRREQVADVAGQEIMTSDKVTLRVNLVVTYEVVDPVQAVTAVADHQQALYREAQLVLRAAVGGRTLDAMLSDKEAVGAEVREALVKRAREIGVAVRSVGLRDIILPGDMKTLLNQVIAATKEAEANLIRRREETAAARSQANTAKLLAESPELRRLKELELLKDALAGARTTFVFGAGDVAEQVRGLVTNTKDD